MAVSNRKKSSRPFVDAWKTQMSPLLPDISREYGGIPKKSKKGIELRARTRAEVGGSSPKSALGLLITESRLTFVARCMSSDARAFGM